METPKDYSQMPLEELMAEIQRIADQRFALLQEARKIVPFRDAAQKRRNAEREAAIDEDFRRRGVPRPPAQGVGL